MLLSNFIFFFLFSLLTTTSSSALMSEELGEIYYHQPFHDDHQRQNPSAASANFPYSGSNSSTFPAYAYLHSQDLQIFDPSYLSFTEFLHGSADHNSLTAAYNFPAKPAVEEAAVGENPATAAYIFPTKPPVSKEEKPAVDEAAVGGENPATPISSISSSSTEAVVGGEKSNKGKKESQVKETAIEDGDQDTSKKAGKGKKKGEQKKEKQPRFAFMTKSEVDHLEDGYRWRKYGQKAVKNSPYPRSYYRCTTQKCPVKKRIERSYQDPSIVITTYEGRHNHHAPATLRGHMAGIFGPSLLAPSLPLEGGPSFPQELLIQMPHFYSYDGCSSSSLYQHQQFQQFPDYGLLQDIIPPLFPKKKP